MELEESPDGYDGYSGFHGFGCVKVSIGEYVRFSA